MNTQEEPNLQLEHVFLNLPCSLWWMDRNHNYVGCNIETCAALRAHSPEEILGKNIIDITETKELSEFKAKLIYDLDERLMSTGTSQFQVKNMLPPYMRDLRPATQLGAKQPIFNNQNEVIGLMGACVFSREVDINQEFQGSLQNLSLDQFKLQTHPTLNLDFTEAFNLMPCSLFWLNREHVYLGCNEETCRQVQVSSQEIIGKNLYEIAIIKNWSHAKAKNFCDLDEFIMQSGMPEFMIESIIPQNNKEWPLCQLSAKKPILSNKNEVIGLMGVAMYNGQFGVFKKKHFLI